MADAQGLEGGGADGFAFVCNQELSLSERADLRRRVRVECEIFHLERLVAILDQPAMGQVRAQYLGISAGDAATTLVDVSAQRRLVRERIDTIEQAISDLIARRRIRGKNRYFILSVRGLEGFYAQFMRSDIGVYVELVSSQFLAPWHRLSPEQDALLRQYDWHAPNDRIPNYHHDFRLVDRRTYSLDLARKVFDTLVHVYKVHEGDPLEIRVSA